MSNVCFSGIYVCGLLVSGYGLLCILNPRTRLPIAWCVTLSFGLGAGATSVLLFWSSLLGFPPSRALVVAWFLASAAGLALHARCGRAPLPLLPVRGGFSRLDAGLVLLLLIPCLWVALEALALPLYNIDAVAIWGLKAKVVAHQHVAQSDYFHDIARSYSHLDYPLLLPFLAAGNFALAGEAHDSLAKALPLAFFVCLLLLIHCELRRSLARPRALLLLVIYVANLGLLAQSGAGLADIALMYYHVGSVAFLIAWLRCDHVRDLKISILMTSCLLFTKNEGIALALINMIVVIGRCASQRRRPKLTLAACYVLAVGALSLPWLLFRAGIPKTHENYLGRLRLSVLAAHVDRIPDIVTAFLRSAADISAWGGLWVLLIAAAILGGDRRLGERALLLWWMLALHLLSYCLVLVITPWNLQELLAIKTFALLLQASPLAVLLIGEYWARIRKRAA